MFKNHIYKHKVRDHITYYGQKYILLYVMTDSLSCGYFGSCFWDGSFPLWSNAFIWWKSLWASGWSAFVWIIFWKLSIVALHLIESYGSCHPNCGYSEHLSLSKSLACFFSIPKKATLNNLKQSHEISLTKTKLIIRKLTYFEATEMFPRKYSPPLDFFPRPFPGLWLFWGFAQRLPVLTWEGGATDGVFWKE